MSGLVREQPAHMSTLNKCTHYLPKYLEGTNLEFIFSVYFTFKYREIWIQVSDLFFRQKENDQHPSK